MSNNTMTIALDGNVTFDSFARAISSFDRLVKALSTHLRTRQDIEWFVDDLAKSSAIATIRGESATMQKVELVVNSFAEVGHALETGERIDYPNTVAHPANELRRIVDDYVTSIRFETAGRDSLITNLGVPQPRTFMPPAYGSVEGRVQTITNRASLRFTLFDTLHDKAVSCYLQEGREEAMTKAWGHQAIVEGLVNRDPVSGRPISVREISSVQIVPDSEFSYVNARGVLDVPDGALPPEETIRRIRDG